MAKINREEYETLKKMKKKGHKFIARSKEGHVIVFTAYHGKSENRWLVTTNRDDYKYESLYNSDEIFLFIGWEDEEPHNIAELIGEYVVEELRRSYFGPKFPKVNGFYNANLATWVGLNESEEIEVKSKQELIEKWESAIGAAEFYGKGKEERLISYMKDFVSDLNQLDEPETAEQTTRLLENVLKENKRLGKLLEEKHEEWLELMDEINNQQKLSKDWIDEHSNGPSRSQYVWVDDLKEVLVPNQEEYAVMEKPTVPQFVANKLEESKSDGIYSVAVIFYGALNRDYDEILNNWILNNEKLFVEAFFAYPNIEVVKEQKYYIQITEHDFMVMDDEGFMYPENLNPHGYKSVFTEQEIKDYDKRFWEFRKPVEEMEE